MRRGEIWTVLTDGYASKPRPVIIIQNDEVPDFQSVVMCLLTSYDAGDIATRVRIEPSSGNGLNKVSFAMTDKILSVERKVLGRKVGVLEGKTMRDIDKKLMVVLGLV
ncbi:type II toxin-antitoxin system PemK/MazF family toxin [Bifidobacterium sp. ESL0732]|uniref:type II toxin-antitoxin system PemK/MazF family toxin n=1 Tax=Bifidobacterium sp. ESL0732 TaxID=2983222 RepID=UPI0023F62976|nr:type II toxin-antitoxin system PemK/MazF family toxin [Bifidobacterium sp. ESL0732]WEV64423.1 type II toxin-antitoxin system PemK/MazF family toxin [Bifidobacterium sp. ESL0732]